MIPSSIRFRPWRLTRQFLERMFLVLPAYIVGLLLPRKLAAAPLTAVFRFKARRSVARVRVWDKASHARVLATTHEQAAAASASGPECKISIIGAAAHRETAAYCRSLFRGDNETSPAT